jgi:hypothetical protein
MVALPGIDPGVFRRQGPDQVAIPHLVLVDDFVGSTRRPKQLAQDQRFEAFPEAGVVELRQRGDLGFFGGRQGDWIGHDARCSAASRDAHGAVSATPP